GLRIWVPSWNGDHRPPIWDTVFRSINVAEPYGNLVNERYLWGPTPGINVLRLRHNEGSSTDIDIALLFASSGDLRNVVQTISSLPKRPKRELRVTINDADFDVVARNVILLLLALKSLEDPKTKLSDIAEAMVHVWYSAFLTEELFDVLQTEIKPLITEFCQGLPQPAIKEFSRGETFILTLKGTQWFQLRDYMDLPPDFGRRQAKALRDSHVLACDDKHYRELWDYNDLSPGSRLSTSRFRTDGILLPYGHPRRDFKKPNPTIFRDRHTWPFKPHESPLSGWFIENDIAVPRTDRYGTLFAHLLNTFEIFLHRLLNTKPLFELFCYEFVTWRVRLPKGIYSRIEVSHVTDFSAHWHVSTAQLIAIVAPLLQPKNVNPHATILTLYRNAVLFTLAKYKEDPVINIENLSKFLPLHKPDGTEHDPHSADAFRVERARRLFVQNCDMWLQRFATNEFFEQIAKDRGLMVKERNTIMNPWPTGVGCGKRAGDKEGVEKILAMPWNGLERYVEWKRAE
ncbi:hypothetical protein M011DRAFT_413673, partial [Sporormia fimetaria CBS 119925]